MSHQPTTHNAIIALAASSGHWIGRHRGDCATKNLPVSAWLEMDADALSQMNKCAASCCGDKNLLVKKHEKQAGCLGKRLEGGLNDSGG